MTDFHDFARRDLRLTILKSLAMQPGFTGNEAILQFEAQAVGLTRSRDVIRTEMRHLENLGAIKVKEAGSVLVGTLMTYVAGTDYWGWLGVPIFWISLLLTVVSGLNYVWKARDVLFAGAK